jgi:hypothetical protein
MREKSHRLPKEVYGGRVSVAFTLCIKDHSPVFRDPDVVKVFTLVLAEPFNMVRTSFLFIVSCPTISIL